MIPRIKLLLSILSATATAFSSDTGESERSTGKVTIANVDNSFTQSDGSCVFASYGIVANYFTRQPVSAYFEGYCRHFGIPYIDAIDAERKYSRHFDDEWKKRKCLGYEIIIDLHLHSTQKCFAEARETFSAQFYADSGQHREELEHALRTQECLVNFGIKMITGVHSITVIPAVDHLLIRDTNHKGFATVAGLDQIRKHARLLDCIIYLRR